MYAVTRCIEIISEASRRLPDEIKTRHPSIAWKNMAGAGNVYRHDYEDVAAKLVWDTVQLALPPLRDVIAQELARNSHNAEMPEWGSKPKIENVSLSRRWDSATGRDTGKRALP